MFALSPCILANRPTCLMGNGISKAVQWIRRRKFSCTTTSIRDNVDVILGWQIYGCQYVTCVGINVLWSVGLVPQLLRNVEACKFHALIEIDSGERVRGVPTTARIHAWHTIQGVFPVSLSDPVIRPATR